MLEERNLFQHIIKKKQVLEVETVTKAFPKQYFIDNAVAEAGHALLRISTSILLYFQSHRTDLEFTKAIHLSQKYRNSWKKLYIARDWYERLVFTVRNIYVEICYTCMYIDENETSEFCCLKLYLSCKLIITLAYLCMRSTYWIIVLKLYLL